MFPFIFSDDGDDDEDDNDDGDDDDDDDDDHGDHDHEYDALMQVHTILSPGDSLGLVIRGGAEYGVCCFLMT